MYLRVEYMSSAKATLVKGQNLLNPSSMYEIDEGHDFTATKGINFFLLFEALSISSGDFVFKVWYNKLDGSDRSQPSRPDYPPGWVDPNNPNNFIEEEEKEEEVKDETA